MTSPNDTPAAKPDFWAVEYPDVDMDGRFLKRHAVEHESVARAIASDVDYVQGKAVATVFPLYRRAPSPEGVVEALKTLVEAAARYQTDHRHNCKWYQNDEPIDCDCGYLELRDAMNRTRAALEGTDGK